MEDRIMSLLEPKGQPEETEKPAEQQEIKEVPAEAQTQEDSKEQTEEVKAEEKPEDKIPEAEEIEYEGKTYKVAPELKDALLRQKDYTSKTQEVAELRKSAETTLQQASQVLELQKAQMPLLGRLASIDEQIAQYEKVDWNTLTAQDATKAQQMFISFQTAKDARQKVIAELQQNHNQQIESAGKARQARLEEGHKALSREIKGWNEDLGKKIMGFAQKAYGAPAEQLAGITEPWAVRALNDAMQWRELQAQKLTEKKAPPQQVTVKPKGAESRTPEQQSYDQDRRNLKNAKTNSDRQKHAMNIILRKLG
jgi:hypothetical protein